MRRSKELVALTLSAAGAVLVLLAGLGAPAPAYNNQAPDSVLHGGPHRTINELAVRRFTESLADDDPRKAMVDGAHCQLQGPRIVQASPWMSAPPEEDQALTWDQWVVEGGFSADEPELYNSFRHFYDPTSWNPDPPLRREDLLEKPGQIKGVPYLTDHLVQVRTYLDKYQELGPLRDLRDLALWEANVKVNAKDWAITGEPGDGRYANRYSWQAGVKYFTVGFNGVHAGKPLTPEQRERAYAMAWRSLGETMHLLADMTCIPHVRNDSHPGVSLARMLKEKTVGLSPEDEKRPEFDATMGVLRHDPYELYTNEALIRTLVPNPVQLDAIPVGARKTLRGAETLEQLFDHVALFTNRHFFSADTIPFLLSLDDQLSSVYVQANYCRAYPKPLFSLMDHPIGREYDDYDLTPEADERIIAAADDQDGFYWATIWDKKVRLCNRTWLSFAGWGGGKASKSVSYTCVEDQASLLLPLAVEANARLVDMFVPKLQVRINEIDKKTKMLRGEIVHTPHGAFHEPLSYNGSAPRCWMVADDRTYIPPRDKIAVKDGRIEADLTASDLDFNKPVVLEVEIGGFRLASEPFGLPDVSPINQLSITLDMMRFGELIDVNDPNRRRGPRGGRGLMFCGSSDIPITWQNGTSFTGSRIVDEKGNKITVKGAFDREFKTLLHIEVECRDDRQRSVAPHMLEFNGGQTYLWSFRTETLRMARTENPPHISFDAKGEEAKAAVKDLKYRERMKEEVFEPEAGGKVVEREYRCKEIQWMPYSNLSLHFSARQSNY